MEDIILYGDIRSSLTPGHIQVLHRFGIHGACDHWGGWVKWTPLKLYELQWRPKATQAHCVLWVILVTIFALLLLILLLQKFNTFPLDQPASDLSINLIRALLKFSYVEVPGNAALLFPIHFLMPGSCASTLVPYTCGQSITSFTMFPTTAY